MSRGLEVEDGEGRYCISSSSQWAGRCFEVDSLESFFPSGFPCDSRIISYSLWRAGYVLPYITSIFFFFHKYIKKYENNAKICLHKT